MILTVFAEEASFLEIGKRSRNGGTTYGQGWPQLSLQGYHEILRTVEHTLATLTCSILVFLPFLGPTFLLLWLGCHIIPYILYEG